MQFIEMLQESLIIKQKYLLRNIYGQRFERKIIYFTMIYVLKISKKMISIDRTFLKFFDFTPFGSANYFRN